MNIPNNKVLLNKDDSLIIDDPRIAKGIMKLAKEWGSHSISEAVGTEEIDELLVKFADKLADLKAKYEVEGDPFNVDTPLEVSFYDEFNPLLDTYRFLVFKAIMDYITGNESIDLMLDIMRRGK